MDDKIIDKVIAILTGMLNGEINVINGCSELDALWHQGNEFIGSDFGEHYSQLAHIPVPKQYGQWNQEVLMAKLQELENYKPNVISTARLLLNDLAKE
jgi:hypothetical protein